MTTSTEALNTARNTSTAEETSANERDVNKLTNVKEVLAYLAQQFPLCFSVKGQVKPLKIGIFQDLAARLEQDSLVSKTQLRQALRVYTSSWRYLEAIQPGVSRVNLEGEAGEQIDQQQADHALNTLTESKNKAAEIRKARIAEQKAKAKPASDKPAYKKKPNKSTNSSSNSTKLSSKAVTKTTPAVAKETALEAIADEQLKVGASVLVKLGQSPMIATVLEVHKDDVTVQLSSGMVVKTRRDSLYQA
ncbi:MULTISPECIES: RNA chaperone ProQ [unclassified Arsukibacterium]|uniref:RNA chaperone ProQ n=1 Tax=unclassified Arsukibacterium TaxID=2635278 RepID=UPI000C5EA3AD|nr:MULTISPECIES: RNA chaperone ProQ [unclassified Arsukibacterium]MAA94018.1 RNA chaperone ProQ [Rheinheimera sp.]MBM33391.1 RNA chaperone ProQ [Rheinheimera sp.]HAW92540.1 RNA chaperone ProQ [Candidatus Azambacteria bacterium]|tara:strand:- start:78 stop:821 length:744 start_codon:yes stop_codon:yes gene_type:complete